MVAVQTTFDGLGNADPAFTRGASAVGTAVNGALLYFLLKSKWGTGWKVGLGLLLGGALAWNVGSLLSGKTPLEAA